MTDTHGDGEANADDDTETRTETVRRLYERLPLHRALDVHVEEVTEERAVVTVPFREELVGDPDRGVLHGGALSTTVDLTGAAVFVGLCGAYTPTVDLRVNYLEAAPRAPLSATATVERAGTSTGVARVEVVADDTVCATGTGVYRLVD
ncbi:PaaI family thioesterase [Halobaculum sp. MBLA0143]|uniref:PaaI family thioesterase n=1 Tax=Halobaculum sp. MBLA0143 TaxID=3079933 RepID=UPI00352697BD